ncbi:hypothetical protein SNEBB_000428 [Seison nebaliae]|nr:hypothetical protein SNEBB_000428 [Seison nebaliae]
MKLLYVLTINILKNLQKSDAHTANDISTALINSQKNDFSVSNEEETSKDFENPKMIREYSNSIHLCPKIVTRRTGRKRSSDDDLSYISELEDPTIQSGRTKKRRLEGSGHPFRPISR